MTFFLLAFLFSLGDEKVIALSEVIERSKETGKHKEAERVVRSEDESESKVSSTVTVKPVKKKSVLTTILKAV